MRIATRYFMVAALLLWTASCGDFGDINIDPNNTVSVSPETLLTSALRSIGNDLLSLSPELMYVQLLTETRDPKESRYETQNFDFNFWYYGPLADLQRIIQLNTGESTKGDAGTSGSNANQIAVARILRAYFFHTMTDRWGPLPYSDALQGREKFRPKYDSQEDIYYDLLKELKEAIETMDDGPGVKGDFLFGGDMTRWIQFANSLRAIIALRMSEVNEELAKSEFNMAVSDTLGFINADVMYPYLAETANDNPWYGRTDVAVTTTMVSYMKPFNDPRLERYADTTSNGDVIGMPFGIEADSAANIPYDSISFLGYPAVRAQDAPIAIMTVAQMRFSEAEAIVRGWIPGDARTMYESAIESSWRQWGVMDKDTFQEFIARPGVAWDSRPAMELIMTQKWIALFLQGVEAWSEWRRTGWPKLDPAPDPFIPGAKIPVRQGYSLSEPLLNKENYDDALILLGGDDNLDQPLWWDIE